MYKKVSVVLLLAILAMSVSFAAGINIDKTIIDTVDQGKTITVTIKITPTIAQENFDLVEFIPENWQVSNWDVTGYAKSYITYEERAQYYYQNKMRSVVHWKFDNGISNEAVLTYSLTAKTAGNQEFISVWIYPSGFSSKTNIVTVLPSGVIFCGNGACETGETVKNCPEDCGTGEVCGNGVCRSGESYVTCPTDCKTTFVMHKFDGVVLLAILIVAAIVAIIYYESKHPPKFPAFNFNLPESAPKPTKKETVQEISQMVKEVPAHKKRKSQREDVYAGEDEVVKRLKKLVRKFGPSKKARR